MPPEEVQNIFEKEYVNDFTPIDITKVTFKQVNGITATIWVTIDGKHFESTAMGNGRLDAVSNALKECDLDLDYSITTYTEHAMEVGSDSPSLFLCGYRRQGRRYVLGRGNPFRHHQFFSECPGQRHQSQIET